MRANWTRVCTVANVTDNTAWAGSGTVEKESAQREILDESEISGAGILRCYLAATAPPFYAYEHVEGVRTLMSYSYGYIENMM